MSNHGRHLANYDSGCSHTLLSASDATGRSITTLSGASGGIITPAFGPTTKAQGEVMIGPVRGTIVDGLHGTLVSPADMLELGYTSILSEENPMLVNKIMGKTIPLYYKNRTWWIDLQDVENSDHAVDLLVTEMDDPWKTQGKTARKLPVMMPSVKLKQLQDGTATRPWSVTVDMVVHLHIVMGHASQNTMMRAISQDGCWRGTGVSRHDIAKVFKEYNCLICQLAKTNLKSPTLRIHPPTTSPGKIVYVDFIPQSIPALDGSTLSILFSDEATGFLHIFNVKSKSQIIEALISVYDYYKYHNFKMDILRSDDEIVLNSFEMLSWLREHGVRKETSIPYQHWQCAIERDMQTVKKGVSALLHDQLLCGAEMWGLCSQHWVNLRNHTPNVSTGNNCPVGIIEKRTIDLRHEFLFAFGQPVCVGIPRDKKTWNWDLKNDLGVYVGQPSGKVSGNVIYFPFTGQILIRGSCSAIHASKEQLMRIWGVRNSIRNRHLPFSELRNFWETVYDDYVSDEFATTTPELCNEGVSAPATNVSVYEGDIPVLDYEGADNGEMQVTTPTTITPKLSTTTVPVGRRLILKRALKPSIKLRSLQKNEERSERIVTRSRGRTDREGRVLRSSNSDRSAKHVHWTAAEERLAEREAGDYISNVMRDVVDSDGMSILLDPHITTTYQEDFESSVEDHVKVPPDRLRGSEYRGQGYTQRGDIEEVWSASDQFLYGGYANAVKLVRGPNNPTTKIALDTAGADYAGWQAACLVEVEQLIGGSDPTLVACDRKDINLSGVGYQIFRTATAWTRKMDPADPTIEVKKKCRICADTSAQRGFFDDTYSPTVQATTLAVLQYISLTDNAVEALVDTVGAFLMQKYPCGPTDKELYVVLDDRVSTACNLVRGQLWRVRRYLYGLPDAGKAYYAAYKELMVTNGYTCSLFDPCLFFKRAGGKWTYAWCHVDDTYVSCSTQLEMDDYLRVMSESQFTVTVKDVVDSYIGIKIERLVDGSRKWTQPKVLNDLFRIYNITYKSGYEESMPRPSTKPRNMEKFNVSEYLSLLGSLIFVLKTRLDIAFAVSFAATKATSPTKSDWEDLMHTLQYLFQTRAHGMILRPQEPGSPLVLSCYCDASWLSDSDSKSQTGFCLSFGGGAAFYGKSIKQPTVSAASTASEQRALFQLAHEVVFIINLCEEIGRPVELPVTIKEDNKSTILLSTKLTGQVKKSRHFLMLIHYVRDQIKRGLIRLEYVLTEENIADILTKALDGKDFQYKKQGLMGVQIGQEPLISVSRKRKAGTEDLVN